MSLASLIGRLIPRPRRPGPVDGHLDWFTKEMQDPSFRFWFMVESVRMRFGIMIAWLRDEPCDILDDSAPNGFRRVRWRSKVPYVGPMPGEG